MGNGTAKGVMAAVTENKAAKKVKGTTRTGSHIKRISLEVLNIFINHDFVFRVIGLVNKRLNLVTSVFLVYPEEVEYSLAYLYRRRIPMVKWTPWPCGLVWQEGKLTLMFCMTSNGKDFDKKENYSNLSRVAERMEQIRVMVGAKTKTFAGTLPKTLYENGLITEAVEAEITTIAVCQAVEKVRALENLPMNTKVIVLGGQGFIGRRVVKALGPDIAFSLDMAAGQDERDWPEYNDTVIVLNITKKGGLENYLKVIKPGTVVINEVYPPPKPNSNILKRLARMNCHYYHIGGVMAVALPHLPGAYKGGVPCCGAWNSPGLEAFVKRLN